MKNFGNLLSRKLLISACCCLILTLSVSSQDKGSCAENLKSAQTSFTMGQTDQVPSFLLGCLRTKGFKKEEELAAYKLLVQTYLLNDKPVQADSVMFSFLKRNPEYKTSPTDHSSFVYLFNNYNVKSILMISFRVGTNIPFLTFVKEYPTTGDTLNSKFSSEAANLFLSLEAKYRISNRIELGAGVGWSWLKFTNNITGYNNFSDINYLEKQLRLEIPVCMTYDLTNGEKLIPYLRTGAGAAINLSTTADASMVMYPGTKQSPITGETLKRGDSRTTIDVFVQAGAGVKYKIPKGFLFLEARTNFGTMEQYKPGGKTVDILEQRYKWSDPGFRLNCLNINGGITIIFYKPSKKA